MVLILKYQDDVVLADTDINTLKLAVYILVTLLGEDKIKLNTRKAVNMCKPALLFLK